MYRYNAMERGVITELDHSGTMHTAWYLSVDLSIQNCFSNSRRVSRRNAICWRARLLSINKWMYFLMKNYFSLSFQTLEIDLVIFSYAPECSTFNPPEFQKIFVCVCVFCFQSLYIDSIFLCHSCEKKGIFFHLASARWMCNILKIKATKQIVKKLKVYDKLSAYCLLRVGSYWKYSTSISFLSKLLLVFAMYPIATYTLQNRTFR